MSWAITFHVCTFFAGVTFNRCLVFHHRLPAYTTGNISLFERIISFSRSNSSLIIFSAFHIYRIAIYTPGTSVPQETHFSSPMASFFLTHGQFFPHPWPVFSSLMASFFLTHGQFLPHPWPVFPHPWPVFSSLMASFFLTHGQFFPHPWPVFSSPMASFFLTHGQFLPHPWPVSSSPMASFSAPVASFFLAHGQFLPHPWPVSSSKIWFLLLGVTSIIMSN